MCWEFVPISEIKVIILPIALTKENRTKVLLSTVYPIHFIIPFNVSQIHFWTYLPRAVCDAPNLSFRDPLSNAQA